MAGLTFSKYWAQWLAGCRGNASNGWKRDQERIGDFYILPALGSLYLSEICSRDIGLIIERARAAGRSPSMLRHIYNLLRKVFNDAVEHFEYIDYSPVRKKYCPKVPRTRRNFLKPADAVRLLEAAKGHWLEPAINIGLFVGLRPCEVQALTWESVDLERSEILIKASYNRKEYRIQPYPKQKDWGQAVIPRQLVEFLRPRQGLSQAFVAPSITGCMLEYGRFRAGLIQLCRKAGVIEITPHELRHSCTELWVSNGATKEDCGRLLNHSSSTVTETYMHRTSERLYRFADGFVLPDAQKKQSALTLVR